jgi:succinate dehydrogenase / fumarate reductase flavoprotein subunit
MIRILDGRGCGPNGDHAAETRPPRRGGAEQSFAGVLELSKTFAHVDPTRTDSGRADCHYMMGGIPTSVSGQALTQDASGNDKPIDGLYAAGKWRAFRCTARTASA